MAAPEIIHGSGINALTGDYGFSMDQDTLYEMILAERSAPDPDEQFFVTVQTEGRTTKTLGLPSFIDPLDLGDSRWGIVWPPQPLTQQEEQHRTALQALIAHRQTQNMGGLKPREFFYQAGWTYDQFLWEVGPQVAPGNLQPAKVPYYLLIVGSPERIPWEFQYYLDGEYAVGRLWFEDPADCAEYVKRLIAYELEPGALPNTRQALLAGPLYQDDKATASSSTHLVRPLYDFLLDRKPKLNIDPLLLLGKDTGGGAFKSKVQQLMPAALAGGPANKSPALLFTAGHGMEYGKPTTATEEKQQEALQGAPLFQEWPGLGTPAAPGHYLSGDQAIADLGVAGVACFCFACFSAGTPKKQDWVPEGFIVKPSEIAARPFVARLPQKLLASGALGFIGHVSRAWEYSILGIELESEQIVPFKDTFFRLLRGERFGHAIDPLNGQWARLTVLLDSRVTNKASKPQVIDTWKARNDFRGYVLIGDPAARLRVEDLV